MQIRLIVCAIALSLLTGCGAGITQIKYIQHKSSTKLKLPDNSIVTAPTGKHYMLYIVNCIDNSSREDAFFFTAERIRDNNNQYALVDSSIFPHVSTLVGGNAKKENVGRLILELNGPPADVFENLFYASHESESVLMVNQTPLGEKFGPSFFNGVDSIDIANDTSSPFINDENPCADKGSYH